MASAREFILDLIGHTKKARIVFFSILLCLVLISVLFVRSVWSNSIERTTQDALRIAKIAECGFSTRQIERLDVDSTDIYKTEYGEIKNSLIEIASYHEDIRFAYIYAKKEDGRTYIVADSELPASEAYSPPGQDYPEASPRMRQACQDGNVFVEGPTTDRWGTWISVFVPMKESRTGKVVAVFGFDYSVNMWYSYSTKQTTLAALLALCILFVYICLFAAIQKNITIKREKRKLSEINEKLSKQEELFRTVYEQSPIGIAISSSSGIIDVNPMFEKIVGRQREEILIQSWVDYSHPDDIGKDLELLKKFFAGEINGYSMDKRYIKPDGSIVWANIILAPLNIGREKGIQYLCLVEDISERLKAESDLLESERSRGVLLSNLPGMAYRCKVDRYWTMEIVSNGCFDLTGYKPESLINNKEISFSDLILPKYRESLVNLWSILLKDRNKLKEEYEIKTASGEIKWVLEQGQGVYDEEGNVVALEGLIIDITDRKKKEEEILYLNHHDFLTGLFNRRFIEAEGVRQSSNLPLSVIIGDINGVKLVNDAFGHAEGDILIAETAKILQSSCRESDLLARTGGDEFIILMPNTDSETAGSILDSIKHACEEYNQNSSNEAYSLNISLGFSTKESEEEDLQEVIKTAEDYMYKRKLLEHKSSHSAILSSIKATMHERSYETLEHAERITKLSKKVGECLKLPQGQIDELVLLATLHDIGKVGIDDRILNKPGALTEEEWVEMKKHSEIGYRIAISSPDLVPVADCILSLHERWDGKGYPQGILGEEIPLLSRIVSVVDAFDAMTSDRPYRKAMTEEDAIQELRKNRNTQFDPKIVKVFIEKVLPKCE